MLEFANFAWTPVLQRDILLLESVQRRATRISYGRVRPNYCERLAVMNLTTLTERRKRGDLVTTFQSLSNSQSPIHHLFTLSTDQRIWGHRFKLAKGQFITTVRQFFIINRVFHDWNSLPQEIVDSQSTASFKVR
ncbi:uncharacterized protein LOC135145725 [Zophobas morio]